MYKDGLQSSKSMLNIIFCIGLAVSSPLFCYNDSVIKGGN